MRKHSTLDPEDYMGQGLCEVNFVTKSWPDISKLQKLHGWTEKPIEELLRPKRCLRRRRKRSKNHGIHSKKRSQKAPGFKPSSPGTKALDSSQGTKGVPMEKSPKLTTGPINVGRLPWMEEEKRIPLMTFDEDWGHSGVSFDKVPPGTLDKRRVGPKEEGRTFLIDTEAVRSFLLRFPASAQKKRKIVSARG